LELDAAAFDEAVQKAYYKLRGRFAVTGFRRGKAPRKLIERFYGENIFHDEAINAVFPDMYDAAIKAHDLQPVDQPEITDVETNAGQGLAVTAEVYVTPDVILGQYKGLNVSREQVTVDDEVVEQSVLTAQRRNAREIAVDDRAVKEDDIVILDYAGAIDGVAFEGGTDQKARLAIGSGTFIPGFEEQMIGMQIGEEKELQLRFPEQYHDEELAGKDVVFEVKVHEIHILELPELDDEFAKDLGFDTFDEYKADIKAKLEAEGKKAADGVYQAGLIKAAAANAEIELPEPMIERELNSMMSDFAMRLAYSGVNMEAYLQHTGLTAEGMREARREDAGQRVKEEWVLKANAKAENIVPTQEQIDDVLDSLARDYRKENDEDFRKSLTEPQMEMVRETATTMAVFKLLGDEARPVIASDEETAETTGAEAPKKEADEEMTPEQTPVEAAKKTKADEEALEENAHDEALKEEMLEEVPKRRRRKSSGETLKEETQNKEAQKKLK